MKPLLYIYGDSFLEKIEVNAKPLFDNYSVINCAKVSSSNYRILKSYLKNPPPKTAKVLVGHTAKHRIYVKQKELDITGFEQLPKEQWPLANLLFGNDDFNQFVTKSVRDVFDTVCPTNAVHFYWEDNYIKQKTGKYLHIKDVDPSWSGDKYHHLPNHMSKDTILNVCTKLLELLNE